MKNKKIYLLFSFLLSLLSIGLAHKTLENDTFSAIKIGDYIIKHGIDFKDHLNEFNTLKYHNARWLFNVIVSFINSHFGFIGIYIFVMILTILIALALFNVLLKKKLNIYISFFLTALTMVFLKTFLVSRAQIFSYLFLILEIFFIDRILEDNKKLDYLWLFILGVLFANIHTTLWLMCLIVILPYYAEYFLSKFKFIKKLELIKYEEISIKRLVILTLVVLVTGFITPLGLIPFTYIFKTLRTLDYTIGIIELQPVLIASFLGICFICFILLLFIVIYKRARFRISDVFMLLGLSILSIKAVRNLPILFLIGAIILGRLIRDLCSCSNKEEKILKILYKTDYITCIIIFIFAAAFGYFFRVNIKSSFIDTSFAPIKIADYINKNYNKEIVIYNDFNSGAYLGYRGIKTFIDSRSEIYCKEFNNTSIMKDYALLSSGYTHYEDIFNKYKITHVITPSNEGIDIYISRDKNYKKILKDDYYTLYEKIQ